MIQRRTGTVVSSTEMRSAACMCASIASRSGISVAVQALFFFSSRRRHTRSASDWSSDVCSSDLLVTSGLVMLGTGSSHGLAQQKPTPPAVTVAPVEQREIVEWDEFTGRTEPVEMVEVRPRVSGYIQEVRFQSGQLVKN